MARLPDRFDLWVRKAQKCSDAARQADYVLGALAGLKEWCFFNIGTKESPQPAETEIEGARYLLLFSDAGRIEELVGEGGLVSSGEPLPVIAIPTGQAMPWCLERRATGCAGLLVNPGDDAFALPMEQLALFHEEWSKRGGRQASGYWIPNMTSEEEDFWQEHGI
jgi:hypothetical protein